MSLKKSRFIKGIILAPDSTALDGIEGEIKVDSSTGKIQVTLKDGVNPSASREIVTSSQTQTLTNKTLTSPVLDTGVSGSAIDIDGTLAANSDTLLASQKAVKTYVDAQIGSKDEADEIIYDNTTSGLVATNVQTAIDEVDGNVDNLVTLSGVALDSTTLGTFTGTTIPDSSTIKSAIQSLETSHESHTGASSGVHGVAGSVVGTSDSQALTNKTIDADLNTISNIENADIKVGAAIARAKLASGTANRIVVNDATGVQVDAAAITASRALVSDANGIPTHSSTTSTEIGHLSGVTSAIQTQLDGKVDEVGGTLTSGSVVTPARLDVKQDTKANLTTYALTATNGQIVYATDTKEMFQVIDGLLEGIGGGEGVGGTDILFAQTFETAALTDFTQTGLSLSTSNPLHGEISALLTHDASVNQLFKQVIPVDNKFRNQTMVLRLDVKSNASAGNVVINIYDETNAANIVASEQLQLSNDVNGTKNSVGFTIPETCASLSYTITALPEAGSPVSRIDDIICELAETALLETAVEVPVITAWQSYTPTFQGFGTPTNIEFEWRQVGENAEIRGKFASGTPTAVEARVGLPAGLTSAGTSLIPSIQVIGKANAATNATTNFGGMSVLISPATTYMNLGRESSTVNGTAAANGVDLILSGNLISFFASVPCSGLSATTTKTIPLTQSGLVQEGDGHYQLNNFTYRTASTATDILYFNDGSLVANLGDHVTKLSDSVNGDQFVATKSGIYNVTFSAEFGTTVGNCYLTKNSTTASASTVLASIYENGSNFLNNLAWSGYLQEGDTLRFVRSGFGSTFTAAISNYLSISYQGSLKQVSVNPNSKITIPTSELRFEGASSRGSTATAIVKFDTLAKIRGDAFTVESDSVLGTRITMKKAGKLDISSNLFSSVDDRSVYISKNQVTLTVIPSGSETMAVSAFNTATTGSPVIFVSYSGFVQIGDVFRIVMNGTPTAEVTNQLNLAFQEQDISVSVTNTLPQFSESDSCVRVDTANGYGSTANKIRRFSNVTLNSGTDIEYADSGTNGASFTIKSDGIYEMSYSDNLATVGYIGLSKNAVSLTTSIQSITDSTALAYQHQAANNAVVTVSHIGTFVAGDIIRVHNDGTAANTNAYARFTISKVGKPNVTGVDVTPFVNVPQPESQSLFSQQASASATSTVIGSLTSNSGESILSYSSTTGRYTALKRCTVQANYTSVAGGNVAPTPYIRKNGVEVASDIAAAATGQRAAASWTGLLNAGEYIDAYTVNASSGAQYVSVSATALSDQILTAPETFSTDTASLTYAGSGTYTLSTLSNAPVGTFITFTYATSTNTRTQTLNTAPNQLPADMNANGILLYTRAFNAASSAALPAAFAIQIGKGLKGKSLDLYKSAGKVTAGSLDYGATSTANGYGAVYKDYNELTGILLVDAGYNVSGSNTQRDFLFSDISSQTYGYLVINASKNPALTGLNVLQPRIATLTGINAATPVASTYVTRTLNTLNDPTAIVTSLASNQFTLAAGTYAITASATHHRTNSASSRIRNITDGTSAISGIASYASSTSVTGFVDNLSGIVTINSTKTFELQSIAESSASASYGIGAGSDYVNAQVTITKIK
jgi:hypothetical protein